MAVKDTLEGNWKEIKGKVREKWGRLTEDDLQVINGKKEQLIGKLQKAYGYAKDRAIEEIDSFERELSRSQNSRNAGTSWNTERESSNSFTRGTEHRNMGDSSNPKERENPREKLHH